MESSVSTTHEPDSAGRRSPQGATTETHIAPISVSREQCSGCGATLAADQRYCVECGQRCGAPRLPFTEGLARPAQAASSVSAPAKRSRVLINNTVIAGVGTLLLAMGIGVLIGRSSPGSSVKGASSPPVQIVTVPGVGAATTTAPTESQTSTSAASTATPKGASSGSSAAKPASTTTKKTTQSQPAKAVKVGSAGKGAGYQKGHFTGNFFGE
jgi:hypothetical protein